MWNKKKSLRTALSWLLMIAILSFAGCDAALEESTAPSKESDFADYTLTFQTEGGMKFGDVLVKVYEDSSLTDLVYAAMTDREGNFTFRAPLSDSYVAVLYPEDPGYCGESYYPVTGKETTITVQAVPYEVEDLTTLSLRVGSIVPNLSVTCTDGTQLSIANLLTEKKAVVLNFWFIGCGPCRMEFPYLEQAYLQYKDSLEVIAINPYDGTDATVSSYAEQMGLTFPVASEELYWQTAMNLRAYPTTVVIDRYGMICLVHIGAVTDAETFSSLFAYVTSDEYVQRTYQSIEEMNP